jgi:hypothetical protein
LLQERADLKDGELEHFGLHLEALLLLFVVGRRWFLKWAFSQSFDNVDYLFDRLDNYSLSVVVEHHEEYSKHDASKDSSDELHGSLFGLGSSN